jgi:hypothetical protein
MRQLIVIILFTCSCLTPTFKAGDIGVTVKSEHLITCIHCTKENISEANAFVRELFLGIGYTKECLDSVDSVKIACYPTEKIRIPDGDKMVNGWYHHAGWPGSIGLACPRDVRNFIALAKHELGHLYIYHCGPPMEFSNEVHHSYMQNLGL